MIERVNEFNHATKKLFITEQGLLEGLQAYESVIAEYDLQVAPDLWATVINFLSSGMVAGEVKQQLDKAFVRRQVEGSLERAKEVLYQIDSVIDRLEGKDIYKVMLEVQDLLIDWNLIGHNFVSHGIRDWIELDGDVERC
ncbi:MAG: hypothetical protein AB2401_12105 [Bacillus sp. (in: firmicutes)]